MSQSSHLFKPSFTVITFDPRLGQIVHWTFGTKYLPVLLDRVHIYLCNQPLLLLNAGSA